VGCPWLSPCLRCGWSRQAGSLSLTSRLDQHSFSVVEPQPGSARLRLD
jgi:hypothetical protein